MDQSEIFSLLWLVWNALELLPFLALLTPEGSFEAGSWVAGVLVSARRAGRECKPCGAGTSCDPQQTDRDSSIHHPRTELCLNVGFIFTSCRCVITFYFIFKDWTYPMRREMQVRRTFNAHLSLNPMRKKCWDQNQSLGVKCQDEGNFPAVVWAKSLHKRKSRDPHAWIGGEING